MFINAQLTILKFLDEQLVNFCFDAFFIKALTVFIRSMRRKRIHVLLPYLGQRYKQHIRLL